MTPVVDRPLRTVSLRRRVALWVLVLLVVVLAGMSLVVNWLLGDALRSDLQQRLADRASYAEVLQEQGVTGQTLADRLTGGGIGSTFVSGSRQYIGHDDGPPPTAPGPRGRPTRAAPAVDPVVTYGDSDSRMTAVLTLRDGKLTLSTGQTEIAVTLSKLRNIELIAGGIAVLVAGLLLLTVVRAALRPLDRMSSLARRISSGTRGRRLRPTNPGTDMGRTALAFDDMLDALETAETQARAAEERMRQFLADASHDLRTPLAGVIAGAEQLLRHPSARAEREERLVQVVRQARRAARLVDDLLLMTRLDSASQGGPAPERMAIDPMSLIRREAGLLQLRRPDLTVTLPEGRGVLVLADPDQLQRAFGNLLDNAATAGPIGGVVAIERSVQGGAVAIRVIDTGPGVPPEFTERIFDRFVRVTASRSSSGSGLGLPISRAIVRAAGGDLRYLPGLAGACFEVVLPAHLIEKPAVRPALARSSAG